MIMKITKINGKINFIKNILGNRKGIALFEFVIVLFFVCIIIMTFIQLGFVLKSEAIVIAMTKNAAREIATTGELSKELGDKIQEKLTNVGITDVQINVYKQDSTNAISYNPTNGVMNYDSMKFRDNFKVVIKATHNINVISIKDMYSIPMPIAFSQKDKVEILK